MERRTTFLAECIQELGLRNAQICQATAEELAGKVHADVLTARAVAPLDRLASLAALVRRGRADTCGQGSGRPGGGHPGPSGSCAGGVCETWP